MVSNVKARFSNGTLMPLEPLELEEGTEVTLHIVKVASANATPPLLGRRKKNTRPTLGPILLLR